MPNKCTGFSGSSSWRREGRSCAVTRARSLFVHQHCGAGGNCWALAAVSGQQEQRCFRQKKQQRAAGGTATATPRPQEIQSSCCQHPRPREKVKSFVALGFFGFQRFPVELLGLCSRSVPAGSGYSRVLMQCEKNTPGYVRKAPGNKTASCW